MQNEQKTFFTLLHTADMRYSLPKSLWFTSLAALLGATLFSHSAAIAQIVPDSSEITFPPQQVGIASEAISVPVTNQGDSLQTLHPGHISVRGKDAVHSELSVLSYNIETDDGDWPARFAYILEQIRKKDIDVIGLQEVIQRATLDNQAMQMADSLGFYYYFDSVDPAGNAHRYGNAIVSRYPITETNFRALNPTDRFRKALHARLDVNGHVVDIYNTHLHHVMLDTHIREEQIADLLDFIAITRSGEYAFLTGDFNANPDWAEMQPIYKEFTDTYPLFHENHLDPEHGTLNPRMGHQQRRIDYVFFSANSMERIIPLSAEIILDRVHQNPRMESDHFGVLARYDLLSDDTDFSLETITEPIALQPGEQTSIEISFLPRTTGMKQVVLHIADSDLTIRGEAFDATVTQLPWAEDFSDVAQFSIPDGWFRNAENWYVFPSAHAGGEQPEVLFWWEPASEGRFYLRTPPFRTTGIDSLELHFRHQADNFQDPGKYDLQLVSIADGEEYLIREWSDPGNLPSEHLTIQLNRELHGVGADRIFLAWVFDGPSDQIVRWSIDDITLDAWPALRTDPANIHFDRQQILTASDTVQVTLANIGGGELRLAPDQIQIHGADPENFHVSVPEDSLLLSFDETGMIPVVYHPQSAGQHQALLQLGDRQVPMSGESFDPTIRNIPWEEDFSSLVQGGIPEGWISDTRNWEAFNLRNAGGNPPEMVFWWQPEKEGRFYLKTPEMSLGDLDSLTLSYRYRVRNFGNPGNYTLGIIAISDGQEYVIQEWVDPGFINPTRFRGLVTREQHGLGSESFRLAWVFDGTTNNMTSWDIDDIRLADEPVPTDAGYPEDTPAVFALEQNYPNPFNPATNISFQVPESSHVTLEVFDVIGRRVAILANEVMEPGYHYAVFDGSNMASGVYLYRMQAGDYVQTRKLMLVK